MNELSLFSGAGGGLLASRLLGWRTIGYVENNDYCQRVLAARIKDGYLDAAPIFGDIRTFVSEGYAQHYRGLAGVVSAGFPCQPFSAAGKRRGADDPRNMWPATRDVIRLVRPRYAFLENVPGLLAGSHGYFGTILGELEALGYDARWTVLSAGDCGAPHLRKRLWVVASDTSGLRCDIRRSEQSLQRYRAHGQNGHLADTEYIGSHATEYEAPAAGTDSAREQAFTSDGGPRDQGWQGVADAQEQPERAGLCESQQARERRRRSGDGGSTGNPWSVEPDVGRVAHGVASRVDRLRVLGNGQVPIVAATAWRMLTGEQ